MSDYPTITAEDVAGARNGDLVASRRVIEGTEGMVKRLAYEACSRANRLDLSEDMEQHGRLTVWEAVSRYEGRDNAKFSTYVYRAISGAIDDEMRRVTRPGVGHEAMKMFTRMLSIAEGDVAAAERLCTVTPDRRRMSPALAHATRLAWEGTTSLDMPAEDADGGAMTLGDLIEDPHAYGVPEDLVEARDIEAAQRERNRQLAHALLALVSDRRRFILKATYGIDPVPFFEDDNEIAAYLGLTRSTVGNTRAQALASLRVKGEAMLNG
ncbi:sigma-70 family RNA polymerase sigma factor [Streptomyces sp. SP17KL33]|uniref:sigma-70 family RNA polymerase sigma factor n=1 Tax=Streptomyces sp. SP17KL33 TaxID=3002534 RepID=UPI002E761EA2|nr:sigma-70 family RNA polymerase sigma factor [Streptomyces sp. SP17KL33]MEE1835777.1 sigma-70 family RNA polymerase sigma factor [Streptomyces sp. SP17KL33]